MFGSKKKTQKQHVHTGTVGDCSPQQQATLVEFRKIVIKQNNNQINPKWDDYFLLRFLRARKFNMNQTVKMWTNYIDWRKKNDVDNILYFKFPQLTQLRKNYPHGYHKTDRNFRPIYIERVGHLQIDKIFKFTTNDRLLHYFTLQYQTLLDTIFSACTEMKKRETGRDDGKVQQTCTILDMKNVSLTMAPKTYDFVKPASKLTQDNYPQILGNMFIINAPMLFTGIWAIVKGWIDEKTRSKIKILGSSFKKELYQVCDPQSIPRFIDGGKCNCPQQDCISKNYGPWNPKGQQMYPYALGLKCKLQQDKQKAEKQQTQWKLKQQKERLQKFRQEEQIAKSQTLQQKQIQKKQEQVVQDYIQQKVETQKKQQQQQKKEQIDDAKQQDLHGSKSDQRTEKKQITSNPQNNNQPTKQKQQQQNIKLDSVEQKVQVKQQESELNKPNQTEPKETQV